MRKMLAAAASPGTGARSAALGAAQPWLQNAIPGNFAWDL